VGLMVRRGRKEYRSQAHRPGKGDAP